MEKNVLKKKISRADSLIQLDESRKQWVIICNYKISLINRINVILKYFKNNEIEIDKSEGFHIDSDLEGCADENGEKYITKIKSINNVVNVACNGYWENLEHLILLTGADCVELERLYYYVDDVFTKEINKLTYKVLL